MQPLFTSLYYDAVVVGAGHAGCEAALALARMGLKTLMVTLCVDSVAAMPCNPAIGGTSKGHLVREIDALGGEMGVLTDEEYIQIRMLNTSKGPAVHSLRAQMDKRRYHEAMLRVIEKEEKLNIIEGECSRIIAKAGRVTGVWLEGGIKVECRAVVLATGVYLKSKVFTGEYVRECGPMGLRRAQTLSASLIDTGFSLRRFKTGTPPRVAGESIDYGEMEAQHGDIPTPRFSFLTDENNKPQVDCYLTYTNLDTHRLILDNITRSSMYSGLIHATGTRYCPSIEDKIERFKDKERHGIFIEPEGLSTNEKYVQGMSTSLPFDVQAAMLRTMKGLTRSFITRPGYAIEYDCLDPLALAPTLAAKGIEGLYAAGQLCGSSGYEEAAAQGLIAGINAGLFLKNEEPLIIHRDEGYIGVLTDDLTAKGTNEPYRMMTSRAEYRLLLRQDNADMRLTRIARRTGLVSAQRMSRLENKLAQIELALKTGDMEGIDADAREQIEIMRHYEGYIKKQEALVERAKAKESTALPADIDYFAIMGLRIEARQKLSAVRPATLGQAGRISGVSPADVAVLMVYLRARTA